MASNRHERPKTGRKYRHERCRCQDQNRPGRKDSGKNTSSKGVGVRSARRERIEMAEVPFRHDPVSQRESARPSLVEETGGNPPEAGSSLDFLRFASIDASPRSPSPGDDLDVDPGGHVPNWFFINHSWHKTPGLPKKQLQLPPHCVMKVQEETAIAAQVWPVPPFGG